MICIACQQFGFGPGATTAAGVTGGTITTAAAVTGTSGTSSTVYSFVALLSSAFLAGVAAIFY